MQRRLRSQIPYVFDEIAKAAAGASGAELANIVNEAALRAVRDGRKFATQADFEESIEVVIAGYQKKNRVLSNKEKLIVAYHESDMRWLQQSRPNLHRSTRSLLFRVHQEHSDIPCRWMTEIII